MELLRFTTIIETPITQPSVDPSSLPPSPPITLPDPGVVDEVQVKDVQIPAGADVEEVI